MSEVDLTPNRNYETTPSRAILALAVGALTGAAAITLYGLIGTVFVYGLEATYQSWPVNFIVFVYALIGWTIGLVVIGLPLWWIFHKLGWRGWYVATGVGVGATCLAVFALETAPFVLRSPPPNSTYNAGDWVGRPS